MGQLLAASAHSVHMQEANAAMLDCGVRLLSPWPAHSPDLNPQENVWGWAEKQLRKHEQHTDTFTASHGASLRSHRSMSARRSWCRPWPGVWRSV